MAINGNAKTGEKKPAHELLLQLLKANNLNFYVRKQEVRFLEDNGILIEPPKVIVYYANEADKLTVPKEKNG